MAAGEDEAAGPALARRLGEVEDLGHVGEVVEGEGHRIGLPAVEQPEIVRLGLDLQVDQLDLVTGRAAPRRPRARARAARGGDRSWSTSDSRDARLAAAWIPLSVRTSSAVRSDHSQIS